MAIRCCTLVVCLGFHVISKIIVHIPIVTLSKILCFHCPLVSAAACPGCLCATPSQLDQSIVSTKPDFFSSKIPATCRQVFTFLTAFVRNINRFENENYKEAL